MISARRRIKEADNDGVPEMTPKYLKKLCLENGQYGTPELNEQLYLQYKGFKKIQNLDSYTGLKVLWLEGNCELRLKFFLYKRSINSPANEKHDIKCFSLDRYQSCYKRYNENRKFRKSKRAENALSPRELHRGNFCRNRSPAGA